MKTTISSVFSTDYTELVNEDEKQLGSGGIAQDVERIFDSLDGVEEKAAHNDTVTDESFHPLIILLNIKIKQKIFHYKEAKTLS